MSSNVPVRCGIILFCRNIPQNRRSRGYKVKGASSILKREVNHVDATTNPG